MLALRPMGLRLRHGVDALGSAIGESLGSPGVDWRNAPDESAAESARLRRQQARTFSQDAAAREVALDPRDIRGMYASNGAKVTGAGMGYSAEDRAFDRMLLGDSLAAMAAPQQSLVNASSGNLPFTFLAMDGSGHFAPQNPIELFGRRAAAETSFGEGFKAQVSDTVSGAWAGIRNFGLDTFDGWRGIHGARSGFYRNVNEMGLAKTLVYYGAQATLAPWMTGGSIVDSGVRTAVNLSKGEMGAAGRSTAQLLESTSMAALSVMGGRQGLSMRSSFAVGERIAIGEGFASAGIGNTANAAETAAAAARMDLSAQFAVSKTPQGVRLQYGDPNGWSAVGGDSHGIIGFVDKDGILGVDVFASAELRAQYGSGRDMYNSMMTRLQQENVDITGIRGAWLKGTDSVNYAQYQSGLAAGLEPAQSALNTWTGKLAQSYGYGQVESITGSNSNVYVLFRKPGSGR